MPDDENRSVLSRYAASRTVARLGLLVALVTSAGWFVACGAGGGDLNGTPASVRTAEAAVGRAVFGGGDLPKGWKAVEPTPEANSGVIGSEQLVSRAFGAWTACAFDILQGGFLGLNRAASQRSGVFRSGDSGAVVVMGAAFVFNQALVSDALEQLAATASRCDLRRAGVYATATDVEVDEVGSDARAYRSEIRIREQDTSPVAVFDLVAVSRAHLVVLLLTRDLASGDPQRAAIIERLVAKLETASGD